MDTFEGEPYDDDPETWAKIKPRQIKALVYINACYKDRGYPPSMRELADHTDVSLNTARSDLDRLASMHLIDVDWGKPRAIKDFAQKGYLGFQDHGNKVWYKNVKLLEL